MNAILPPLSVLVAVFAAAVPWGLPADATFILPLVVVMMVFCWRALHSATLPAYAAVLLGLLTDITSGGPLGFWALMCLIAANAGDRAPSLHDGRDVGRLWLIWSLVATGVGLIGWLLASLYFLRWIDWWPIAFGAGASIAIFPVVMHGVLWIKGGRIWPEREALFRRWT